MSQQQNFAFKWVCGRDIQADNNARDALQTVSAVFNVVLLSVTDYLTVIVLNLCQYLNTVSGVFIIGIYLYSTECPGIASATVPKNS